MAIALVWNTIVEMTQTSFHVVLVPQNQDTMQARDRGNVYLYVKKPPAPIDIVIFSIKQRIFGL